MIDAMQLRAEYYDAFYSDDEETKTLLGLYLNVSNQKIEYAKILLQARDLYDKVSNALITRLVVQAVAGTVGSLVSLCTGALGAVVRVASKLLLNPYVLGALAIGGAGYGLYKIIQSRKSQFDNYNVRESNGSVENVRDYTDAIHKNQSIIESLKQGAKTVGIDPSIVLAFAKAESAFGLHTNASTSSAKGVMQITSSTWNSLYSKFNKKYGIPKNDRTDPLSAAIFSSAYIKDVLIPAVKRVEANPDIADIYTAYVFGPGGGSTLIKETKENPNQYSADVLASKSYGRSQINANRSFFYHKNGAKKTLAETREMLRQRVALTSSEKLAIEGRIVEEKETQEQSVEANASENRLIQPKGRKDKEYVRMKDKIYEVQ